MPNRNDFEAMRNFDDAVLQEIVREGEIRLRAQFDAACASDQRAMAWSGFLIATATASLGGGATLIFADKQLGVAMVAILFSIALFLATFQSVAAVRPGGFDFPGNEPKNWQREYWRGHGTHSLDIKQARIEQAECLQLQIEENIDWAKLTAGHLRLSMDIAMWSVLMAAILMIGAWFFQVLG